MYTTMGIAGYYSGGEVVLHVRLGDMVLKNVETGNLPCPAVKLSSYLTPSP